MWYKGRRGSPIDILRLQSFCIVIVIGDLVIIVRLIIIIRIIPFFDLRPLVLSYYNGSSLRCIIIHRMWGIWFVGGRSLIFVITFDTFSLSRWSDRPII